MCEVEVSVSGVPSLCARKASSECRFHLHRGTGQDEEFVTIRVIGPGSESVVAAVRQWLEAQLSSGAVTMSELRRLDIRVKVARGIVVPVESSFGHSSTVWSEEWSSMSASRVQEPPGQKPFNKVA